MNHEFEPVACRSIVIFPFEDVSGLAVECLADGVQRGEADGFGTSVLQNGHVGGSDANLFGELADAILRLAIMTSRLMRIVISNHLLEFAPEPDKENSFHTATNAASMQNRNSTPIMRYGQCIDVWLG